MAKGRALSAGVASAMLLSALILGGGALAAAARSGGNRATPEKPKHGSEYLEGKPTVVVNFRWKLPKGEQAGHIEISRSSTQNPDGSFRQVTRSTGLQDRQKKIRIGIPKPNRYYWHVSSSKAGHMEDYGPPSTFVVLNTLAADEALKFTKAIIKDRITTKYRLRHLGCRRKSHFAAKCKWSASAGGYTFHSTGTTYLSKRPPDNFRYYHYRYHVDYSNDACVADHHGKTDKCSASVNWRA